LCRNQITFSDSNDFSPTFIFTSSKLTHLTFSFVDKDTASFSTPVSQLKGPSPSHTLAPSSSSLATLSPFVSSSFKPIPIPPVHDEAAGVEMSPGSSVSALWSKCMNTHTMPTVKVPVPENPLYHVV
ncbi:type i inositol--trisphosphate 5-phosphatase 11, partial [Moniliophthora roreri]